tara:strand:+ start:373 stop:543 length:171 start_codon:yes stop_codon:yes gene_type:complete
MYTTSKELFNKFAPTFNFELDEEDILRRALDVGFVVALPNPDGGLLYKVNEEYGNE